MFRNKSIDLNVDTLIFLKGDTALEIKDYKPNSDRYREQSRVRETKEDTTEKKDKVTSGKVSTKKQSVGKKISSNLFIGDMTKIVDYFIYDVAIPAGKKFIWDSVTSALDISLNGDARRHEYSSRDGRSGTRTAYNRVYDDRNGRSSSGKVATRNGTYDYDEVIFETIGDANLVLDEMWKDLDRFKQVSIADMYDHAGVTSDRFTDNQYGWRSLRGADVGRNTDGTYYLKLPKPEALD